MSVVLKSRRRFPVTNCMVSIWSKEKETSHPIRRDLPATKKGPGRVGLLATAMEESFNIPNIIVKYQRCCCHTSYTSAISWTFATRVISGISAASSTKEKEGVFRLYDHMPGYWCYCYWRKSSSRAVTTKKHLLLLAMVINKSSETHWESYEKWSYCSCCPA